MLLLPRVLVIIDNISTLQSEIMRYVHWPGIADTSTYNTRVQYHFNPLLHVCSKVVFTHVWYHCIDTAISYERELIVSSFLQDFAGEKEVPWAGMPCKLMHILRFTLWDKSIQLAWVHCAERHYCKGLFTATNPDQINGLCIV